MKALQNAGFDVMSYDNGLSAYQRLREEPFELLLTDIVMPEMDGIELARRQPVVIGHDVETGILQRLHQESAHVDIVFGKQDFWA